MRNGWGIGLIVCVLVPIALLLFGIASLKQAVSLILLLSGLWAAVFGALFERGSERLYEIGFGLIVASVSTFIVLPLQYTAGLVVVVIIAMILVSVVLRPKPGSRGTQVR